jgi:hypothetical protein
MLHARSKRRVISLGDNRPVPNDEEALELMGRPIVD